MSDIYGRRLSRADAELAKAGLPLKKPMWFRVSTAMGAKPRPPFYANPLRVFLICAVYFAVSWGGFMWLVFWQPDAMSWQIAVISSVSAGVCFGAIMAGYYAYAQRKHNLSEWTAL